MTELELHQPLYHNSGGYPVNCPIAAYDLHRQHSLVLHGLVSIVVVVHPLSDC